jgi:hypothetical protein
MPEPTDEEVQRPLTIEPQYIGDGVYASFDGYQVWVQTHPGCKIALEYDVMDSLLNFAGKIWPGLK